MPRTTKNPKKIIYEKLEQYGPLAWTQLLERTSLSKGALSKHLNELIENWQWIETDVDTKTRPPTTIYKLVEVGPDLPKEFYENPLEWYENLVRTATISALKYGTKIGKMKNRKMAEEVLEGYLRTHLNLIALFISDSMYKANEWARGYIYGRPFFIKSKDPSKEMKKTRDVFHKRVRKYCIREFLEPWIEALADAYFVNVDIAQEVFAKAARKFGKQVDVSWANILEQTEEKG